VRPHAIAHLAARQILDSRGRPTLEVDVVLASGALGRASVPTGVSTGRREALELRDGGDAWHGNGVRLAIATVREHIAPHIAGLDAREQERVDAALLELDGTAVLARLGANAVLGASLATARAAAAEDALPLWRYLGGARAATLPVPMLSAIEGGVHADNLLSVQEILLVPLTSSTYSEALRVCAEAYTELGYVLLARHMRRTLGDQGGFAPPLGTTEEALDLVVEAVEAAGYQPGEEIAIAIDAAAAQLRQDGGYRIDGDTVSSEQLIAHWADLCARYPIIALEDGLDDDWPGWHELTQQLRPAVEVVGDDLFATHAEALQHGIDRGIASAVVIKPNQVGTLTDARRTAELAAAAGYASVAANRSGDTEDTAIADLAVGLGCDYIKAGAPARSERAAKHNRLLRIEEALGAGARLAGRRHQFLSDEARSDRGGSR
jgi:enolase